MTEQTKKVILNAVVSMIVLLLLAGGVVLAFYLTNGFTEDFKDFKEFYLTYGEEKITVQETKLNLKDGESYTFGVNYVFETANAEPKDFSVKIVSMADKSFSYTVDDLIYGFENGEDFSTSFDLKKTQSGFSFTIPKEGLLEILSKHHAGKETEIYYPNPLEDGYYFSVVVTSYNEKASYTIKFKLLASVSGVELDQNEILI